MSCAAAVQADDTGDRTDRLDIFVDHALQIDESMIFMVIEMHLRWLMISLPSAVDRDNKSHLPRDALVDRLDLGSQHFRLVLVHLEGLLALVVPRDLDCHLLQQDLEDLAVPWVLFAQAGLHLHALRQNHSFLGSPLDPAYQWRPSPLKNR